jgi:ParB family chromosome partitioning protein
MFRFLVLLKNRTMVAKKSALGRGLGALIEDANVKPEASINEIDIDQISGNPFQPRTKFDEETLQELARSIKELGIIQPVTVRQIRPGKFQLISGERRFRAAKIAGMETIPAYVRMADDQAMLELALVENIQRDDLDAIEVAISYQRLIEECDLTQETLSDRVGKKRSTVSNYLRLLRLPAEIQLGIRTQDVSMGHARALINVDDPGLQLVLFNEIVEKGLSVRQTEELVRKKRDKEGTVSSGRTAKKKVTPPEFDKLREQLSEHFKTQVEFKRNTRGAGKIVIPFESDADLERIVGILDRLEE